MKVKRSWTTMQQWVVNNWESYLIIHCRKKTIQEILLRPTWRTNAGGFWGAAA
jgi:hypothetical protein